MFAIRGPVLWLPLGASVPLHPPDAVQEVALVELQVSVEAAPLPTTVSAALRETVGAGGREEAPPDPPPHAANINEAATAPYRVTSLRSACASGSMPSGRLR